MELEKGGSVKNRSTLSIFSLNCLHKTRPGDLVMPDPFGRFFLLILDHIGPIWIYLDNSVFLDLSIFTRLFGSVSLDPSI